MEVVIVILHDLIASNNDLSDLELSFLQKTNNCRSHVLMEQTNSTTFTRFDKFNRRLPPGIPRDIAFIPSSRRRVPSWRAS